MEERQHTQYPVITRQARFVETRFRVDAINLPRVRGDILMAKHRAFGCAGGSAGILQLGDVLFGVAGLDGVIALAGEQFGIGRYPAIGRNSRNVLALEQPVGPTFGLG